VDLKLIEISAGTTAQFTRPDGPMPPALNGSAGGDTAVPIRIEQKVLDAFF
jgi:hypothetical protein